MQDIVAGEYHLDVLGINLQGGRKNDKKKHCVSPPQEKRGEKIAILAQYQGPGVRGQGPAGYHTSQIRPRSIQIRPVLWLKSSQGGQKCCGADFGSRKKISGHPLGQSAWFFEIYLVAAARTPKNLKFCCVSSPAYSLRAPLWQIPIPPTKGRPPCGERRCAGARCRADAAAPCANNRHGGVEHAGYPRTLRRHRQRYCWLCRQECHHRGPQRPL